MKKYLYLVAAFLLLTQTLSAQTSIGPWGGDVRDVAIDAAGTLYAGASGNSGLFRSSDGGTTWSEINNGISPRSINALAISGTTVIAGGTGGVYRTTNNGAAWSVDTLGSLGSRLVWSLFADASGFYAGTSSGSLHFRTAAATSWTSLNGNLPQTSATLQKTIRKILRLANGNLLVATQGGPTGDLNGIYLSTNSGTAWTRISTGLPANPDARGLVARNDTLWAAVNSTGGGVWFSANNGTSWQPDTNGIGARPIVNLLQDRNNTLYAFATRSGATFPIAAIYTKPQGASQWTIAGTEFQNRISYAFVQKANNEFVVAQERTGIYRTTNFTSATLSNRGLNAMNVNAMIYGANSLIVGLDGGGGIMRTGIAPQNWTLDTAGLGGLRSVNALARGTGNTIYVGLGSAGVYKSTTDGATWFPSNIGIETRTVNSLFASGDTIIAGLSVSGTSPSIFRSTDGGATWIAPTVPVATPGTVWSLGRDAGGNLYAGMSSSAVVRGIFVSTDGGATWAQRNGSLPLANNEIYAMHRTQGTSNRFYAALNVGGAYFTTNAGQTWTADTAGQQGVSFNTMFSFGDLNQPSLVGGALGSAEGGVFVKGTGNWFRTILTGRSIATIIASNLPTEGFCFIATGANSIYSDFVLRLNTNTEPAAKPREYRLSQNYPNPFNPSTGIRYEVSGTSDVRLEVFDMLGRKVATLVDERKTAGAYQVNFNAANLASGIYFYRLRAGAFSETKKMMLVK
jgi:hypothetical protein